MNKIARIVNCIAFPVFVFAWNIPTALGKADVSRTLNDEVGLIFNLQSRVSIGTDDFDKAVLSSLRSIGVRRDCVEAVFTRAEAVPLAVDVFCDRRYMSFDFEIEDRSLPVRKSAVLTALIEVQWGKDQMAERVHSQLRWKPIEPIRPPSLVPDK